MFLRVTRPPLLWTCLVLASCAAGSVATETDGLLAQQTQQQHLHTLFLKYGENGTISLPGLMSLLKSLGLDRIQKVVVQHHGKKHNHTHLHTHAHAENVPTPGTHPGSVSITHLNIKSDTTPSYITKPRRANRNAAYDPSESRNASQPNVTHHVEDASAFHTDYHNYSRECQNATAILQSHGMSPEVVLSFRAFGFLCPALLVQIDSKSCLLHAENQSEHESKKHSPHVYHQHNDSAIDTSQRSPSKIAWLGGFLSITIISLLALAGGILIPFITKVCFNFLLSFLVALAVGTLSGDALLHLIPHSQRHHVHYHGDGDGDDHELGHEHEHEHEHGHSEDPLKPVLTGLTVLAGIYFMFLIEHFLTLAKMYKDKKQKIFHLQKSHRRVEAVTGANAIFMPMDLEWNMKKRLEVAAENLESQHLSGPADPNAKPTDDSSANGGHAWGEALPEEEVMLSQGNYVDEDCENKCHSHFHDTVGQSDELHHHHHNYHHILHHHHSQNHHPHTHTHRHTQSYSVQHFKRAGVATLAWMIIMGDGLRNFSDGVAIGAGFTESLAGGLSTAVAVFCHELPHKLGDFAVLLKAGMTIRQVVLYNLLSALMGYLGMVTGVLIGHYTEGVTMWIFAVTAGLFLYVALVDMVPEMLHNDATEAGFSHYGFFVLQNAGMLLGFGVILLIAMFEHEIQLGVDF